MRAPITRGELDHLSLIKALRRVSFLPNWASQVVLKNPPANAGDTRDVGSIPGSGRSPGIGNGNPLRYSYLKNPMDRGTWQATVPGVAQS